MRSIYFANSKARREYKQYRNTALKLHNKDLDIDNVDFSKPIIPIYHSEEKKGIRIIGNTLVKTNKDELLDAFGKLKTELHSIITYKTIGITSQTFMIDVMRILNFPIGFLVFPVKKYYMCDKKEVKEALKDKCLMAPNHTTPYDAPFIYFAEWAKRIRIIAYEGVFKNKAVSWAFRLGGAIEYDRDKGFDFKCFKTANGVLNGNGCIAIFPQGHVMKPGDKINDFKPGLAMFSLRNNAPIIPYYYKRPNMVFRTSHVVVGKPIYPEELYGKNYQITNELIEDLNKRVGDIFLEFDKMSLDEIKEKCR